MIGAQVAILPHSHAITPINVVNVVDTATALEITWRGLNLDNGSYDAQFEVPTLTNWAIGDITEATPAGGNPWTFSFQQIRHVTNPHPGECCALPVSFAFNIDYPGGFQADVLDQSVSHPGPENHFDHYQLIYSYGNADPLGGRNSNLVVTLNATHNVPGPLPILGLGAVFGYSRKLRTRIKDAKPEVISTTAV
jgi:hypothetical protein